MNFYGLVNEIKEEHKSGIYGKKSPNKEDLSSIIDTVGVILDLPVFKLLELFEPFRLCKMILKGCNQIKLQKEIDTDYKKLIFPNNLLMNSYDIEDELSYGLFDGCSSVDKAVIFKKIMMSSGGSNLIVLEKKNMPPNLKHYGGEKGKFNEGIYISHPKDPNLLLPLANFNHLIQSLIIEETIRAFEALGAKKITIEDVTSIDANSSYKEVRGSVNASFNSKKEILRIKEYGKGTFNEKRALKDKLFIHDIPAVMSTIEARISGNQIIEEFQDNINLGIGMDTSVLDLFQANMKFKYNRQWHFRVEFYDKNGIN